MKLKQNTIILIVLLLIFITFAGAGFNIYQLSTGYITGSQGLEAQFNSIKFKNYWYSSTQTGPNPQHWNHKASVAWFFDTVNFDPDASESGFPNLKASQQPIVVDPEVDPKHYGPWRIKVSETDTEEIYKEFEMLRYRCEWSINLWLDGSEAECISGDTYTDTELWIKIVPKNFLYFTDNPDQVFFAPAYFGLSQNPEWGYYDQDRKFVQDATMGGEQDIFPKASGETLGIFYGKAGTPINMEDKLLSYQGANLDPQIFRNEYWIRIGIDRFHSVAWQDWIIGWPPQVWRWKNPSVNLKFTVYVYVVGQWTVTIEKGDVAPLEPHQTTWMFSLGEILGQIMSSPLTWIILGIIVLIIIAILAPGVLSAILAAIGLRRRR